MIPLEPRFALSSKVNHQTCSEDWSSIMPHLHLGQLPESIVYDSAPVLVFSAS